MMSPFDIYSIVVIKLTVILACGYGAWSQFLPGAELAAFVCTVCRAKIRLGNIATPVWQMQGHTTNIPTTDGCSSALIALQWARSATELKRRKML